MNQAREISNADDIIDSRGVIARLGELEDEREAAKSAADGHWLQWGLALRGLLNGDVGPRLDCGTLDAWILDTLRDNGIETENL